MCKVNEPVIWDSGDSSPAAANTPDNIISLDISTVKNLQIGYQAETLILKESPDRLLSIHEYIGNTAYEYLGKVTSNRFKTTVRYGRREEVNKNTYVIIYLPKSWKGELNISTQYGHISTEEDWELERFAAETNEGDITLKTLKASRIHLVSSKGSIRAEHTIGFTDLHCMSGSVTAHCIDGGGKLETSTGPVNASFASLNNTLEVTTLHGNIVLNLPANIGIQIDGISKRGQIQNNFEDFTVRKRPGNMQQVLGSAGRKPFYKVRLSTITGNISLGITAV